MRDTNIVYRGVTKLLLLVLFVIGLIFVITKLAPTISGSSSYPAPGYDSTSEERSTDLAYPPPQENTISTPIPPSPTPRVKFKGAECFIDSYNGVTLWLPTGWFGHIANSPYGGASKIFNYDPSNVQYDHGAPINLPDSHIDVQITSLKLEVGQTLEQWVAKTIEDKNSSQKIDNLNGTAGQYSFYTIGNYDGFSYSVTDSAGWNAQMITIEANGRIIILNIFPANSPDFPKALEILNTLDASGAYSCSTTYVSGTKSTDLLESPKLPAQMILAEPTCAPTGTFPGDEAPNSSIPLQMPFLVGQEWVVGGGGSFYGNYHHCNYYNNYYATDWNTPDNDDKGKLVLAIADGTVTSTDPTCGTERYGCYVDITHSTSYRSRYAHLETVLVSVGQNVIAGTPLGTVGDTGVGGGNYHLHLSFWHYDYAGAPEYFSRCYDNGQQCPNGEIAQLPQGHRPSCMETIYGCTILLDGYVYNSVNSIRVFMPHIAK